MRALPKGSIPPAPDWSRRILRLRHHLGLSQADFGSRLHYSAMAVSRWERGTHEPTAQCYVQLGNLAGEPECWMFWSRAGLKSSVLNRMFPEGHGLQHRAKYPDFDVVMAGSGKKRAEKAPLNKKKVTLVAIPVLALNAATRGERGDHHADLGQVAAEEMIAAPAVWCPNPAETSCLRVKGSSMAPMINDGDIIAVDCSQSDPGELSGKIVVAWHREHGLSVSRFVQIKGMQLLDSENREYEPISFGKDRSWRIVGKVLWWVSKAP